MDTSSFAKRVSASSVSVGGSLLARDHATFGGEVDLSFAKWAADALGPYTKKKASN